MFCGHFAESIYFSSGVGIGAHIMVKENREQGPVSVLVARIHDLLPTH